MNTLKIKKAIIALWLAVSLIGGHAILAPALGLDMIPQTHACSVGNGGGGGCA